MSTIKNQRCFTEATASARLILATGLTVYMSSYVSLRQFSYRDRPEAWVEGRDIQAMRITDTNDSAKF